MPDAKTVRNCGGCGGELEDWEPGVCSSQCAQAVVATRDPDEG